MNLIHYIQGIRKGTEINRLEREAMEDPFLAEAMEGYDKVRGNHEVRIKRIQSKISTRPPVLSKRELPSPNHTLHQWSIAATLFLLLSIGGGYLWWTISLQQEQKLVAENTQKPADTIAPEILEEPAADSPIAQDELKENNNLIQQPKAIIMKDEEIKTEPVMDLDDHKMALSEVVVVDKAAEKKVAATTDTVDSERSQKLSVAPQPAIGIKAYNDYLKANLIRPADEECKNATGVVTLSFLIDKTGHPYDIRIVKSLCPLSDWEAMRLLKEGPAWTTSELYATLNVNF